MKRRVNGGQVARRGGAIFFLQFNTNAVVRLVIKYDGRSLNNAK